MSVGTFPGIANIKYFILMRNKKDPAFDSRVFFAYFGGCYIIPPIPPAGIAGIAGASLFFSASTHSVVRNIEAIDAAFSNATRATFVGSMIPAFNISSYLSSRAL